jgi:pyruvate formate lyase activating enzyme
MKIISIQKTTLIDFPNKIACTLFFYGCNFRCGFCHNPELVIQKPEIEISEKEVLEFLDKRKKYLEGVCLTGGEPLLTVKIDFLKKIKEMGYLIKIDTNGSFPEKLKKVIEEKLVDFIAMDIKSSKENYGKVTNSKINTNDIEKSIKLISNSGIDYEFRTTIIDLFHDEKEIENMGKWANEISEKKPKKFVLQGFKNNGKFIDEEFKTRKDTSSKKLNELKEISKRYFENVEVRE